LTLVSGLNSEADTELNRLARLNRGRRQQPAHHLGPTVTFSARTREPAGEAVTARRLEPIRVPGIDRPIEVFEVPVDGTTTSP
jgi:class 3 adenylate cyclase